jgi:hypothetical protein
MIRAADDYVGGGVVAVSGSDNVLELIRVLAVLHFANFLAAFAALGIGVGAFAYQLAWSAGLAPRGLGWLGLIAGGLLLLTPLAVTADVLFLPFFFGAILTLVWLLVAGLVFALRPVRPGDAASTHGSIGSALPFGGFGDAG